MKILLKKSKNVISSSLSSIDRFHEPLELNFKGENGSRSALGGFFSMLVIVFLAYQAIFQTKLMFERQSVGVIQINSYENDPSAVYLDKSNKFAFLVAAGWNNGFVNFSKNSPLSFKARYYQQIFTEETVLLTISEILFAPCNMSHIPENLFSEKSVIAYFMYYAYCPTAMNYTDSSSGLCPEHIRKVYPNCITPPDFKVQGRLFSSSYDYVSLEITLCNQEHAKTISGLNCSTDKNISLVDGVGAYLGISNIYIDPSNYTTPNQAFFDLIDWQLQLEMSTVSNIPVDNQIVQDFDHFLFTSTSKNRTFPSISVDKVRDQQIKSKGFLLQALLTRSMLNRITSRTYLKMFDVMSNVGGLLQPLLLIGSILTLGYARYKHFILLSNELYDFEIPQKPVSTPQVVFSQTIHSISGNKKIKQSGTELIFSNLMDVKNVKANIDMKDCCDSLVKKKKLEYGEINYIKGIFLAFCRKKNPEKQLAEKAKKKVIEDLDISHIVKKIKEIDQLKMLLLNENQLEAFKFIKKPTVRLKGRRPIQKKNTLPLASATTARIENKISDLLNVSGASKDYDKLYNAYQEIKKDKSVENVKINEKLLLMIDQNILNIFAQLDVENESPNDSKHFEQIFQGIEENKELQGVEKISDKPPDQKEINLVPKLENT